MNEIPAVRVEYVKDESIHSQRRTREVVNIIFQMMLLARKRGRPAKNSDEEVLDAA